MGGTPIIWKSEWQGAVQTSTYSTEISSICLAVEEANTIRYMLRSLRIKVSKPSNTIGDNEATIICQTPLKKKHIALSYHFVRENTATKTINTCQLSGKNNVADLLNNWKEKQFLLIMIKFTPSSINLLK